MDRLDELSVLISVIETGSMSAAAKRLRLSAPSVTRAIATLEKRVGRVLFQRTTRNLVPTEIGLALAERARGIVTDYAAATQDRNETNLRGLVRVTAPMQYGRRCVAPIVYRFLAMHPEVRIDLVLSDRNLDLLEGRIDLAVRIGNLTDSNLRIIKVGGVSRVLVASPEYLAARSALRHPRDLKDHEVVMETGLDVPMVWQFGTRKIHRVRLSPRLLINDVETQRQAVLAGCGVGRFLSYQVAEEIESGRLVRLLAEYEPPDLPVHVVYRHEPFVGAAAKALTASIRDALKTKTAPARTE